MVDDGTVRRRADFALALGNVNNVKMSDLLELLLMLLFFPFVLTRKSFAESCKIMKTSVREIFFDNIKKISGRSSFPFSPATSQKHI